MTCPCPAEELKTSTRAFGMGGGVGSSNLGGGCYHVTGIPDGYEQPLVAPQVSHFRQAPFLTIVKQPQSEHASPV